ncbi:hypothetical protein [Paractinoplanes rishiriensis]|uniref:hypothetical protein n=1 Tax=Paractinoplanes rishiriensis TaxID=1050105 RepID=UPI001EF26A90|nr:hypothetical protein [Actinoplanes rishiriensis]
MLSGGGPGPLARTAENGQQLVWTWTGYTLPKPTLDRTVATYEEVLPGVDLKMKVDEWGFSEVLVVKAATAATSSELTSLRFALSGTGLSAAGAAGTARTPQEAVTGTFAIGDAYMWDSTRPSTAPSDTLPEDARAEGESTIDGPGSAARVAQMPMVMQGRTLVITPVQSLLTDPAAKFPIFIDPKSSSPGRSHWTMINKGHPGQQYWSYDRGSHAKVGNAGDTVNMYRSLFQFSTAAWRNKHVTAVTFANNLLYSWACSNTTTQLHISSQTLSSATTWNSNASSWGGSLATVSNQNCKWAPSVASEFTSSALTSAVHSARANASITIGLRAANETVSSDGSNGWKKFDETSGAGGAHLSVTYNTAPVLSNLHTDAGYLRHHRGECAIAVDVRISCPQSRSEGHRDRCRGGQVHGHVHLPEGRRRYQQHGVPERHQWCESTAGCRHPGGRDTQRRHLLLDRDCLRRDRLGVEDLLFQD